MCVCGRRHGVVGPKREDGLTAASEDLKVRNAGREKGRQVLLPEHLSLLPAPCALR